MSDDNKGLIDLRLVVEVLRQHGRFDDEEGEVTNNLQDLIDSLSTKEGAGVPVAYVVRDAEGGSLHDFTDYYNADQFWIRNRSRMLKPQFLFCYDAPAAVMPAAPSDAVTLTAEHRELIDAVMRDTATSVEYRLERIFKVLALSRTMQPQAEGGSHAD